MSDINVVSKTQRIIVDPFSQSVAVVNAGPQGPVGARGPTGPPGPGTPNEYVKADGSVPMTSSLVIDPGTLVIRNPNAASSTVGIYDGTTRSGYLSRVGGTTDLRLQAEVSNLILGSSSGQVQLANAQGASGQSVARRDFVEAYGAKGQVAYAQVVANVTLGTTAADVAGLSITYICEANRRYRVRARLNAQSNVAADMVRYQLLTDGAQVDLCNVHCSIASQLSAPAYVEKTYNTGVSAGSHTFKVTGYRITGTGTSVILGAASNFPAFIELEDIGPVTAP